MKHHFIENLRHHFLRKETMEEEQKQNEGNKLIENLRHVINIVFKNISSTKSYFLGFNKFLL